MYENSHIVVYGYIEAWTYHPMLNISVMPQRRFTIGEIFVCFLFSSSDTLSKGFHFRYNLAPLVTRKLNNRQVNLEIIEQNILNQDNPEILAV